MMDTLRGLVDLALWRTTYRMAGAMVLLLMYAHLPIGA